MSTRRNPRCHVADSVVSILSKSPLPPLTLLLTTEPGASSLSTTWQPIMGSTTTTTTRWPHSNTTTQPPPARHDGNTTMARTPCSGDDHNDAHEHDNAHGRQTQRCRWTTRTTDDEDEKQGTQRRAIIVVYSVSKDPPPPFIFLIPILVATSPTVTFGNRTTNDEDVVVHRHSLFYHTYIIQYFLCIFFSLNQVPCRWKRHGTQTTNDALFVIVNIIFWIFPNMVTL